MAPAALKQDFEAPIAAESTPIAPPTTHTQTAITHKLRTETHTTFLTATVADDTLPASSLPLQDSVADSTHARSISPEPSLSSLTPSPETMRTSLITAPRRSTYPRPSPPSFLYPEAIVPHSAHAHVQAQRNMQHPALPTDDVIWYLPFGLEVVIGLLIVLGLIWAGMTSCVSLRRCRWKEKEKEKAERRPLDKPSRYAKPSKEEHGDGAETNVPTMPLHEITREDVRRRTKHRRNRSYEPSTQTPTAQSSPCSLFLLPTSPGTQKGLEHRTSAEYVAQHTAFFSPTRSLYTYPSAHSSDPGDYAAMDTADIEALEAGKGHERKKSWVGIIEGLGRKKSWVDMGIGKAGDVVSGLVGSWTSWTDEDDEGHLLPVVDRRRDGLAVERRREDGLFLLPVNDLRRQIKLE